MQNKTLKIFHLKQDGNTKHNHDFSYFFKFIFLIFFSASAFAKEPANLHVYKEKLAQYHASGQYEKDIHIALQPAYRHLKNQLLSHQAQTPHPKKLAIILDIDETALSNYHNMKKFNFGYSSQVWSEEENKATLPPITPTLKLYQFAKSQGIAIIFLTGREESEAKRIATAKNLKNAGYRDWDKLILKSSAYKHQPSKLYKAAIRKQLTEEGYIIILNVGDQTSDLVGKYATKAIKLPNPYYVIP